MVFGYITVQAIRASAMKDMVDPIVPKGPVKFAIIMEPGTPHKFMAVPEAIANAILVGRGITVMIPNRPAPIIPQNQPTGKQVENIRIGLLKRWELKKSGVFPILFF